MESIKLEYLVDADGLKQICMPWVTLNGINNADYTQERATHPISARPIVAVSGIA